MKELTESVIGFRLIESEQYTAPYPTIDPCWRDPLFFRSETSILSGLGYNLDEVLQSRAGSGLKQPLVLAVSTDDLPEFIEETVWERATALELNDQEVWWRDEYFGQMAPAHPDPSWKLLGYDVCTSWLYREPCWGTLMNQYGLSDHYELFQSRAFAEEWKRSLEGDELEAPFVLSIWEVPQNGL